MTDQLRHQSGAPLFIVRPDGLPDPHVEVFCAEEGWGPWWVPRALGYTRSGVRTFIAGLVGERYVDLTVRAKRGNLDWRPSIGGWWFTVDPTGVFAVWEVAQA